MPSERRGLDCRLPSERRRRCGVLRLERAAPSGRTPADHALFGRRGGDVPGGLDPTGSLSRRDCRGFLGTDAGGLALNATLNPSQTAASTPESAAPTGQCVAARLLLPAPPPRSPALPRPDAPDPTP